MRDGKTINDIEIYLGGWSDEITYYKQIEGMVEYGLPRGFFGYDQSRAVYGPFGVWGIFPLLPYYLIGSVAGFGYCTMMYVNIFMCMMALFVFVWLIRPNKRTMLTAGLVWILYYELNRYVLSAVVEALFIAAMIIIFSLGCYLLSDKVRSSAERDFCWKKDCAAIVVVVVLICYISVCRPYYSVLFLIPFLALARHRKRLGCVLIVGVAVANLVLFFVNYRFFCSKYYADILDTDTLGGENFLQEMWNRLLTGIADIAKMMWYAIRYADGPGWYYFAFFLGIAGVTAGLILAKLRYEKLSKMYVSVLLGYSLIILSIILIYDVGVGARHVLALNMGCMLLLCVEWSYKWNWGFAGICLLSILLVGKPDKLPYATAEYDAYMSCLEADLRKVITVTNELSYDNVVAMPTRDFSVNEEGKSVSTYYGNLFALPAGVGISLDHFEIYNESEKVLARYVLCHPEGVIRENFEVAGKQCIYENEQFALYAMY